MERSIRNRLVFVAVVVVAFAGLVFARLVHLQVVIDQELRARAENQHRGKITVQATRGSIVDRNGEPLALSLRTRALYAHPERVENAREAAAKLAPVLGQPRSEIERRLAGDDRFVYLHRALDAETVAAVRALDLPIGGDGPFGFLPSSTRIYPHGRLAVHVVGFATIDGRGVEGIEKAFDDELGSEPIVYRVLRDGRRGGLREVMRSPDRAPLDVVLTIDMTLQHIVERELDLAMQRTGSRAAAAVLLDPTNGDVVALANRPAADLARYSEAGDEEKMNRAVWHRYEPGSTFKVLSLAAALENDVVDENDSFYCEDGRWNVRKRTIRDSTSHGMLAVHEIFAKSSNIGMAKIARLLEPRQMWETLNRFGVGSRLGIELPGESAGMLSPPERWTDFTRDSVAFGHEVDVTVLQMTSMVAAVANGGLLAPPRVVLGVRDADGGFQALERPAPRRVVSAETAARLTALLEEVLLQGTGARAAVDGYSVGGKTGTAQKLVDGRYTDDDYVASFVGFAPLESPRLVAMVLLDQPPRPNHHGGTAAAPTFSRIMEAGLRHIRVPAQDRALPSSLVASREPPREPAGALVPGPGVPDVTGLDLRSAVSRLARAGCRAQPTGSGRVTGQRPAAGSALPSDGTCRLRLEES